MCVRWCDTSTHPFTILCDIFNFVFVLWILVQYNSFMIFLNINVLAFLLHVLLLFFKLMSLILVTLNCPVRDDYSFLT